jgi:uncharacterized membrane protein (UPF0127 family)
VRHATPRPARTHLGRGAAAAGAAALGGVLLVLVCARPAPVNHRPRSPDGLPLGEVILHPVDGPAVRVRVELAVEQVRRQRGLMFRRELAPDAGMLFVFPPPDRRQAFWMRNTFLPLDMIFIDGDRRVVGVVERAEPRTDTLREVDAPSRYVLEVNGGFAAQHGVGPGARVDILGLDAEPEPERP